jgi:hypothetical protein
MDLGKKLEEAVCATIKNYDGLRYAKDRGLAWSEDHREVNSEHASEIAELKATVAELKATVAAQGREQAAQGRELAQQKLRLVHLANNVLPYPATFLVLPVMPASGAKRSLLAWLTDPAAWLGKEMMVVFLCGRTLKRVQYGGEDGLRFTVPNEAGAKLGAFWEEFGPYIKVRA